MAYNQGYPQHNSYMPPPNPYPPPQQQFASSYYPPAPAPAPRHPPPPPSSGSQVPHFNTVEDFRGYYAYRLRQLTFNSRPIIQDLSLIALYQRDADNWPYMQGIVEEIDRALQQAAPQCKLPLLYLVDSISKNVGRPYTDTILPFFIPRMFVGAYREVDGVTKTKIEEMMGFWRTGGPNGNEMYGRETREIVEMEIFGSREPASAFQRGPSRETVLQTLHATLERKQNESAMKEWSIESGRQIDTLNKILNMINTTQVSQEQLQQIMDTLQNMDRPSAPAPASQPPPSANRYGLPPVAHQRAPPPQLYQPLVRSPIVPNYNASPAPPAPNLPPFPPQASRGTPALPPPPTLLPTPPDHVQTSTPQQGSSTPLPAAPAVPLLPDNVAALIRNLNSSGIAGISSLPRTPESEPIKMEKPRTALDDYEDMVLSLDMKVNSLDLNKMSALPTSHLPHRCTQCGDRFVATDGVMQAHLDWHFRRNRKQRESEGRGAHRRWLPRAEEWIKDAITNEAGSSTAPGTKAGAAVGGGITTERAAQLRKKKVKVPTDPNIAAKPCPVCKEPFKAEWSEEDEEWVWRNAIDINEKRPGEPPQIYHAICRAEQMSARVANRLLKDGDGRRSSSKSPRLTPGLDMKPEIAEPRIKIETVKSELNTHIGTPPALNAGTSDSTVQASPNGIKRKAEDDQIEAKRVKVEPGAKEELTTQADASATAEGQLHINGHMTGDGDAVMPDQGVAAEVSTLSGSQNPASVHESPTENAAAPTETISVAEQASVPQVDQAQAANAVESPSNLAPTTHATSTIEEIMPHQTPAGDVDESLSVKGTDAVDQQPATVDADPTVPALDAGPNAHDGGYVEDDDVSGDDEVEEEIEPVEEV